MNENNFHEIANDDADMYEQIVAIPTDDDNMVNSIMTIVRNHISEVWSPPRVTELPSEYGLSPGFSYDIQTDDETRHPWDFDRADMRSKCVRNMIEQTPHFLIGSPMCTALNAIQGLNRWRMAPGKWDALWEKGIRHMRFAVKFYRLQAEAGRFFLHEHPNSASRWKLREVMTLMSDLGITKSVAHLCRYGMTSKDGEEVGCVNKPTGFLTKSIHLKDQLQKTCTGGHRHVKLVGGRAKACQIYPQK